MAARPKTKSIKISDKCSDTFVNGNYSELLAHLDKQVQLKKIKKFWIAEVDIHATVSEFDDIKEMTEFVRNLLDKDNYHDAEEEGEYDDDDEPLLVVSTIYPRILEQDGARQFFVFPSAEILSKCLK